MRSNYVIHSLMAAALLAAAPLHALTIASPTEGQRVRDKVAIVMPKAYLPLSVVRSGFIAIKIDGRFTAAISGSVAAGSGENEPASPNVVYVWDTKRIIDDPLLPLEQRHYRDGQHEITIEAHGLDGASAKDVIAEKSTVKVNLQNKVPLPPPPTPPMVLRYRYMMGQKSLYKVSVAGELLDNTGYGLTGGQIPILAEFEVAQSVEDLQPGGAALLRYKVQKDAVTQVFGQNNLVEQIQGPFRSVYKIIDSSGAVIEDNVLSDRSIIEVTDCLIRLPGRKVQLGESWITMDHIRLEGLCDLTTFTGTSTLEGLEWESGYECAKIVSALKGSPAFRIPQLPSPGAVEATNTAYFAYKPGKLVKDITVMEFNLTLDSGTLASIQQQMPQNPMSGGASTSGGSMPTPGMPGMRMPGPGGMGGGASYSAPGGPSMAPPPSRGSGGLPGAGYSSGPAGGYSADSTPRMTSVRVRLVVTKELVR